MTQTVRLNKVRRGARQISKKILDLPVDQFNRQRSLTVATQSKVAGNVARLKRFSIVSVSGDYLTCYPLGVGAATTDTVDVAKNYLCRRSPFDGETRNGITYTYSGDTTRTADDGVDNETQVIVPAYVAGDQIKAFKVIGGTGVTNDAGEEIYWEDVNNDGRAWALQTP